MNPAAAPRRSVALLAMTSLVLAAVWLANAWVSEDAHITVRVLDNFVRGDGLRWNLDQRVQVYTHPLWLLLLAPAYALTGELYWTVTAISLALVLGAYLLVARHFLATPWVLVAGLFAPWILSRCLRVYATSGFENPLTTFLLAAFAAQLLGLGRDREPPWGRLVLLVALAGVNRLDSLALFAPALLALAIGGRPARAAWGRMLLGATPLLAWLLFSLFYYGFLLPNTAYAKLSAAIPRWIYLRKGALYLADFCLTDPVSLLWLALGSLATVTLLRRGLAAAGDRRAAALGGLGAGALAYGLYVLWIGGDFLSGRFWSAPVFASIVVVATQLEAWRARLRGLGMLRSAALLLACLLALAGARWAAGALRAAVPGVVLARSAGHLALDRQLRWQATPRAQQFRELGERLRREAARRGARVATLQVIGLAGLAAGPELRIVDPFALADPLLARLPPVDTSRLQVGHLLRAVPAGYLEARETGDTSAMSPSLAAYYEKLRLVVSGPLLDPDRLRAIAGFQCGAYDALLRAAEEEDEAANTAP